VPRKSIASMMVAQPRVDGRRARLQVPEDLSPPAKEVWSEIVSAVPGEHFRASDEPLLRSYAEACALADQAAAQLATNGPVVAGKVSPWLVVLEKAHRAQSALAIRLRLCPSSRTDPKTVGRAAVQPPSVYEIGLDEQD
jgi:hypothetical protein